MRLFAAALFALSTMSATGFSAAAEADYRNAIAHSHRSEADRRADMHRHPLTVLQFAEVQPGEVVLDVFAGGGYYSELLAHVVGEKGRVDAFNNQPYLNWVGDQIRTRLADNALPNVRRLDIEVDDLSLPAKHYDLIIASMAFHDLYYADPANGWPEMDVKKFYQTLHRALKPNGRLIVIDHSARPGTGVSATQSLHRIDEQFLMKDLQQAGFVLDEQSDALRNSNDNRDTSSFEPRIRYQTDRFLWRMKKSGS